MGNLGAQKAKRNDTPISAKKDIMGDKTVRVRADLHHIIKIETAKNGGNVKEVMDKALEEYIRKYLPDKDILRQQQHQGVSLPKHCYMRGTHL